MTTDNAMKTDNENTAKTSAEDADEVSSVPSPLDDRTVLEVRKLEVGPGDLLVLRGDFPEEATDEILTLLRQENPKWEGLCAVISPEQDILKLPRPMAYELYCALHSVFGDEKQ